MALEKAKLINVSDSRREERKVLFNPTEYSIERGSHFAEIPVPGLPQPIIQYVRGRAQTLSVELFLDGSRQPTPVEDDLTWLRSFATFDGSLHAAPILSFEWGDVEFEGVVTSMRERLLLFNEQGQVLRARVTLNIRSIRSASVQQREAPPGSPDRTRFRVVREGETLAQLAFEAYGDPGLWRVIAEANDLDRPRFIAPGTALVVPSLDNANASQLMG